MDKSNSTLLGDVSLEEMRGSNMYAGVHARSTFRMMRLWHKVSASHPLLKRRGLLHILVCLHTDCRLNMYNTTYLQIKTSNTYHAGEAGSSDVAGNIE